MKLYLSKYVQNAQNVKYPESAEICWLEDLQKAVEKDHIAVRMKDSSRSNDNFIESDCIMLDLDNTHSNFPWDWKEGRDVEETFPDVKLFEIASRNCFKEKTGKDSKTGEIIRYEPRYKSHFYFPLSKTYTDKDEYEKLMLKAAGLFPYFDLGAARPAQFFFGSCGQSFAHMRQDCDLYLDTFLENVSPEEVKQSIIDFSEKVRSGDYESPNNETHKAINRLCNYFDIRLPASDSDGIQGESQASQGISSYSDESLEIARAEQARSLNWLKQWATEYGVTLGTDYRINTKDHPEGLCICTPCPWEHDHTEDTGEKQSVIIIDLGGKLNYLCRHNHCLGKSWKDFRAYHEGKQAKETDSATDFEKAAEEGFFQDNGDGNIPFTDDSTITQEPPKKTSPILINFAEAFKHGLPDLEPVVIEGILRKGGKMLVTASSKAGKTQILALLTVALSEGGLWLGGINCLRSRVLFVNFELSAAQMLNRFKAIYWEMQKNPKDSTFDILNLKGRYDLIFPLETNFVPRLISSIKQGQYDVVILDPIYKMFQSDENSSETIAEFGRYTDRIIQETGCSLVYSHHHSKGAQGGKNAMDRGSGSGVFARDADAIVDFLEIEPKDCGVELKEGQAAFRIEFGGLRSFQRHAPLEVVSAYPLFIPRDDLRDAKAKYGCNDASTNAKRGNIKKQEQRDANITMLRNFVQFALESGRTFSIDDAAEALDKGRSTIREYVKSEGSCMEIKNNNIYLKKSDETKQTE